MRQYGSFSNLAEVKTFQTRSMRQYGSFSNLAEVKTFGSFAFSQNSASKASKSRVGDRTKTWQKQHKSPQSQSNQQT